MPGGWPESVDWPLARALRANRGQIDEVARVDIRAVDGVRRDPQRVRLLLRSLARNVGTAVATSKLAADPGGRDNGAMKPHTAADYLNVLERIMIVENQPAWALLDCLVSAAFAFHPLVWLLRRGIERCRETSCDAEVLARGFVRPKPYAVPAGGGDVWACVLVAGEAVPEDAGVGSQLTEPVTESNR